MSAVVESGAKLSKIELAKAERCGLELAPELAELAARGWENLDEADLAIRLKWLGIFFRPVTPGRFMVRLRLPNGVITADQLEVLADAVDRCGEDGSADITTRQNIQLRGLLLDDMAPLMAAMEAVGLTSRQSGHDNPRNITGNPLAGIDPEELVDTRPLVAAIQSRLLADDAPTNLPRKFNIAVGGAADSFLLHNDLAFLPAHRDGELGFTVMVGGFFSAQRNELAIPLGVWLRGDALPLFSLAVLRHFEQHGNRQARNKSRLMYLIDELGLDGYRAAVMDGFTALGGEAFPHDGSHRVNRAPRSGLGVNPQKQEGLSWVGLSVPVGRLDPAEILAPADLPLGDWDPKRAPEPGFPPPANARRRLAEAFGAASLDAFGTFADAEAVAADVAEGYVSPEAARAAGRDPASVTLVAVSKTHGADRVREHGRDPDAAVAALREIEQLGALVALGDALPPRDALVEEPRDGGARVQAQPAPRARERVGHVARDRERGLHAVRAIPEVPTHVM